MWLFCVFVFLFVFLPFMSRVKSVKYAKRAVPLTLDESQGYIPDFSSCALLHSFCQRNVGLHKHLLMSHEGRTHASHGSVAAPIVVLTLRNFGAKVVKYVFISVERFISFQFY